MTRLIAVLGGFTVTLLSFGGGALLAITYLVAEPVEKREPVDAAATWPSQPVSVGAPTGIERLPARPASPMAPQSPQVASAGDDEGAGADMMTTATVGPEAPRQAAQAAQMAELGAGHLEWCGSRYRSYRPGDNSYQPYSGGRRPCVSPYLEEMRALQGGRPAMGAGAAPAADFAPQDAEAGRVIEAAVADADEDAAFAEKEPARVGEAAEYGTAVLDARLDDASWNHAQSCFERYRSYRPEDNSYQPFGGGPRRQCE
jgi:hypothetical protein